MENSVPPEILVPCTQGCRRNGIGYWAVASTNIATLPDAYCHTCGQWSTVPTLAYLANGLATLAQVAANTARFNGRYVGLAPNVARYAGRNWF